MGLDADGTRDLVKPGSTGLLLPLPGRDGAPIKQEWSSTMRDWHEVCKDASSPVFLRAADGYARLISKVMVDHGLRKKMSRLACTDGVKGYTWWDAMEVRFGLTCGGLILTPGGLRFSAASMVIGRRFE